jgi:DNA-directed RNA polymerase subunit RPC12/RpoP
MASWALPCSNCEAPFTHSQIAESNVFHYLEPAKPEFPPEGEEHQCPNCGYKAKYHRTDLIYHL